MELATKKGKGVGGGGSLCIDHRSGNALWQFPDRWILICLQTHFKRSAQFVVGKYLPDTDTTHAALIAVKCICSCRCICCSQCVCVLPSLTDTGLLNVCCTHAERRKVYDFRSSYKSTEDATTTATATTRRQHFYIFIGLFSLLFICA